ncbi:MAG: fasciclin domain-containing protein [Bacteroidales bacterium]|nr:fasciclin domain-containing protein [Bacteroidales bacterium]
MKVFRFNIKIRLLLLTIVVLITASVMNSCEDPDKDKLFKTAEGITIGEYIDEHPDTLLEFNKVLAKVQSVSFLKAYGQFTCFIPSNEAFQRFYAAKGKSSVDDFVTEDEIEFLKQVVAYHICPDSMGTSDFTEGGLPDTTMSGDYLTTSFEEGGLSNIVVNDKARIIKRDIVCENGIIHIIDEVLDPVVLTVAEMIDQDPQYTIFSRALKETGLYDSLNMKSIKVTLFAESDSAFAADGIHSYDELLVKFSQTGAPYLNPEDTLYLWVAYHCVNSTMFLTDLQNMTYENFTRSIIFSIDKGIEILMNKTTINVGLSNNTAKNGNYHALNNMLGFVPIPVAVYWEVTDYPDLWALTDVFRLTRIDVPTQLPDGVDGITIADGTKWEYRTQSGHYHRDYFQYWFDDATGFLWFEFETPALVTDAEYNLWICGKCVTNDRAAAEVYFDDELLGHIDMGVQGSGTDEEMLANNMKYYTESNSSQFLGFLIGKVYISAPGKHRVKLVKWDPGNPDRQRWVITLDMMHFIPVDKVQNDVKFPNG